MKSRNKELTFSLLVLLILITAVFYFLNGLQYEKQTNRVDLFTIIPPDTYAVLYINKNSSFQKLLQQPAPVSVFNDLLPHTYLSILRSATGNTSFLIAFCTEGILLYGNTDKKQLASLRKNVFEKLSTDYSPLKQKYRGSELAYYPAEGKKFLGYYYQNGVFITSYNKRLLEESVLLHKISKPEHTSAQFDLLRKGTNVNVPANFFFQLPKLHLDIPVDSPLACIRPGQWTSMDISSQQEAICGFGVIQSNQLNQELPGDSLCSLLNNTLTYSLQQLFPRLSVHTQISKEGEQLYYFVCGSLSVSTTKPSYE